MGDSICNNTRTNAHAYAHMSIYIYAYVHLASTVTSDVACVHTFQEYMQLRDIHAHVLHTYKRTEGQVGIQIGSHIIAWCSTNWFLHIYIFT